MTASIPDIASRENPSFRRWLRIAQGRPARADGSVVLLEGRHLCEAWREQQGEPLTLIVAQSLKDTSWVRALVQRCPGTRQVVLQDVLASALSQVEHGPAVFCIVEPPQPALPARLADTCLWLDRVQDPGNLGTLLRTAAAAGIRSAFLSTGCAQAWSPKVLRSGQGAHFALRIHERVDLAALAAHLDVPLAVTTLDAGASLYATDLRGPCAWLFGNEGRGVAPALLAQASVRIHIPQASRVESLNVAAAAAICLFEQRRQQGAPEFKHSN